MSKVFISYNKANRQWVEWIAWQPEEKGHPVILQAWDFRPEGFLESIIYIDLVGFEADAKEHFRKAAEIIEKTGYGRRQGAV